MAALGKLAGKTALITGGNRGIGAAIARAFAREGASLVLAARDGARLDQTVQRVLELGSPAAVGLPTDVSDETQVEKLFQRVMDRFGRLDVLVNNAGAFDGGPIDHLSTEKWDRVMAVNLRGPFLCSRAAFRIMKEQKGGRIVNIASISAQRVRPRTAAYATTKHGLWGLTQVTALEGREYGIIASCLHPGNTINEWRAPGARPEDQEPMMQPDELAEAALLMAT
ncbi:MAG: SDR family NAD(P)-dependent oxidoreductase, partial [Gammaproteobacteria bacterium]